MKKFAALFLALLMMTSLVACGGSDGGTANTTDTEGTEQTSGDSASSPSIVFKLGHVFAVDSPSGDTSRYFKEILEERSNGTMSCDIYYNSEIGGDKELIESMGMGAVDMAMSAPSVLAPFSPRMGAFNLPFMFESPDQAHAAVETGLLDDILASTIETANTRILAVSENGFRQLEGRVEVTKLADLNNLKARAPQNEMYTQTWTALGCGIASLPFGEIYTALQTGVADVCEVPLANYYTSNFYEVGKYVTITNYSWDPICISMSELTWQKLTPEQQEIVQSCAVDAAAFQLNSVKEYEAELVEAMTEAGVTFNELTDEARAEFKEATQSVVDSWEYPDDVAAIQAALDQVS